MIFKIVLSNLFYKKANLSICLLLLALATAIVSILMIIEDQLGRRTEKDLRNFDMVIGAKGSPLQLVLSAVYHIDAPTGNINKSFIDSLGRHPMVASCVPLAYGDFYSSFPIIGTTSAYITMYGANCRAGKLFTAPMEVVVGDAVAKANNWQVGTRFVGSHGAASGEVHAEANYVITGILERTNTVLDRFIITSLASVWQVHNNHEEAAENHHTQHQEESTQTITAALVKFRMPMGIMTIPRMINQQSLYQAAIPNLEVKKLFRLMGIGITLFRYVAFAIIAVSMLSIFLFLYHRLQERKYMIALLRTMGSTGMFIFGTIVAEGFLIALIGGVIGLLISRLGIYLLVSYAQLGNQLLNFQWQVLLPELLLLLLVILLGIFASVLPAYQASRIQIAKTLSNA